MSQENKPYRSDPRQKVNLPIYKFNTMNQYFRNILRLLK